MLPITAYHDTAGPMTRTVADAAIMLGALESAAPDPNDAATRTCTPPPGRDYTKFLRADALKGARIGIPRAFYYDRITLPGESAPRPSTAPVKTLTELRQWNITHIKAGAIRYGQSRLDISDEMDLEADRARNEADHEKDWRLSRVRGIDGALNAGVKLDAIMTPGGSGAGLAARAGYPIIVVPFGMVPNAPTPPFPSGFEAKPAPFGVGFTGTACSEPRLIEIAYAFEQATKRRVPPPGLSPN